MPVYDGQTVYVEERELFEQFTSVSITEADIEDLDYADAAAVPDADPFVTTGLPDAPIADLAAGEQAVPPIFAVEVYPNAEHHPIMALAETPATDIFFATDADLTGYILVGARNRAILTEYATQCETVKRVLPGTCSPAEALRTLPETTDSASPTLSLGDTVTITDGPFEGSLALVDGVNPESEEAQVIIDGGPHKLPIKLSVDSLTPAESTLEL